MIHDLHIIFDFSARARQNLLILHYVVRHYTDKKKKADSIADVYSDPTRMILQNFNYASIVCICIYSYSIHRQKKTACYITTEPHPYIHISRLGLISMRPYNRFNVLAPTKTKPPARTLKFLSLSLSLARACVYRSINPPYSGDDA